MCVFIEEVLVAVQYTFNFTNEIKSQNINKQSILVWTSQVALAVKNAAVNAGEARDGGSIPGLRRSPGGGNGNPLQYSCLENLMDRGAWRATVHSAAKSLTWLRIHTHYSILYTGMHQSLLPCVAISFLALV